MKQKTKIIISCLQLCIITDLACAMDQPKEYSTKLTNIQKALILIEAIQCGERNQNITVKPSRSETLKIKAVVLSKDVAEQEKYYTEEPFFPFFVHQATDQVTIKPYCPGNYTVYVPAGSQFSASTPHGTVEIHEEVKPWNIVKK
jgi:hypothetical protein